jgi:hypothetical protein
MTDVNTCIEDRDADTVSACASSRRVNADVGQVPRRECGEKVLLGAGKVIHVVLMYLFDLGDRVKDT